MKKTFSGHFHQHQVLGQNGEVVYVGSPLQLSFNDAGAARGVVILDSDTGSFKFIENPQGSQYLLVLQLSTLIFSLP